MKQALCIGMEALQVRALFLNYISKSRKKNGRAIRESSIFHSHALKEPHKPLTHWRVKPPSIYLVQVQSLSYKAHCQKCCKELKISWWVYGPWKAERWKGSSKKLKGWKGSFFSTVNYSEIGEFYWNWGFVLETILGTYGLCTSSSRAQNFNFTMFRLIRIKIHK